MGSAVLMFDSTQNGSINARLWFQMPETGMLAVRQAFCDISVTFQFVLYTGQGSVHLRCRARRFSTVSTRAKWRKVRFNDLFAVHIGVVYEV